jgi:hypothetical protein
MPATQNTAAASVDPATSDDLREAFRVGYCAGWDGLTRDEDDSPVRTYADVGRWTAWVNGYCSGQYERDDQQPHRFRTDRSA